MRFADPMRVEDSDEEDEIVFARNALTPSPEYGIRDLPTRSRIAIANRDDGQNAGTVVPETQQEQATPARTVRSTPLPQPPASSSSTPRQSQTTIIPQSPRVSTSPPISSPFKSFPNRSPLGSPTAEPQSLTLRFASISLAEERERERQRQPQQQVSGPIRSQSPVRTVPGPASPVRQHQGWPVNVPPLPRAPGNSTRPFFGTTDVSMVQGQPLKPNGISSPSPASLPTSPTHPARHFPSSPNLNVAFDRNSSAQQSPRPPPHLQSQQTPQLSDRQLQKRRARDPDIDLDDAPPPSLRRSPSPVRQGFTQPAAIEIMNDTPPRRQWTPGHDVVSRNRNPSGNSTSNSYAGSQSPERRGQPPTQPLIQSLTQAQQTAVPKISLPDGHHDDSDVDDAPGPSIVVSRPGSGPSALGSAQNTPVISISEAPSIMVSEDGAPAISRSAADSSSVAFSPPRISVSDSAQPQRPGPSAGNFGSRHTQIQESSPSHPVLGRGPSSKRGLPPPPSPSNLMRTNGLSCGGCNGPIIGRIVSAMGQRWHPHCFRCTICSELLEHVSSYEHDGKPYCHLDYHEAFAPRCFHCKTAIIDERFITLDDSALGKRTYHEQHFFCAECGDPFLAPSSPLPPSVTRTGELNFMGDGEFVDDDVGFTVYKGHPYCEACHVRLRLPKCKACKKSIRDGVRAVEALGGKWCWGCFVCEVSSGLIRLLHFCTFLSYLSDVD
ncbi:hypothetical protein EV363DRAFT_666897 [Boletus edulis]|nr:hypothetical protein EV363DRAFT_666897 [Boletus edulis]